MRSLLCRPIAALFRDDFAYIVSFVKMCSCNSHKEEYYKKISFARFFRLDLPTPFATHLKRVRKAVIISTFFPFWISNASQFSPNSINQYEVNQKTRRNIPCLMYFILQRSIHLIDSHFNKQCITILSKFNQWVWRDSKSTKNYPMFNVFNSST